MNIYELKDVFVEVGLPKCTFVRRPELERSIESWRMNSAKHLLIFGASKSGKTSLWKKCIGGEDRVIKVPCNSSTSLQEVYSIIAYKLNAFYSAETSQSSSINIAGTAEAQGGLGRIGSVKAGVQLGGSGSVSEKYDRAAKPIINSTFVAQLLKKNNGSKIVVLEDFHYASEEFKSALAEDLKAFSDDNCPWILVGVQHRTSGLLAYNQDLQQRVSELSVEGFNDQQLEKIITLGGTALNIDFSKEISERIVQESLGSASLVQYICQKICQIMGIYKTERELREISDVAVFEQACREIARENKAFYEKELKIVSLGGRSDGSTEKYKWFLKLVKEVDIPEQGLRNTEVFKHIKALGHNHIDQTSVTSGLAYLPKLIESQKISALFDYENKTFYLLDKYMKFVLRWIPELVDNLFLEEPGPQQLDLDFELEN
jgi:AAA+ ATPase superfamily predicted ATPase